MERKIVFPPIHKLSVYLEPDEKLYIKKIGYVDCPGKYLSRLILNIILFAQKQV